MSENLKVVRKIHFAIRSKGKRQIVYGPEPIKDLPNHRICRISRLMALAIHFDNLIRAGGILDYAELASLGHISRARVSQIMNLLLLAPDIQEEILFLPPIEKGDDPITERDLRPIVAKVEWSQQKILWNKFLKK